MTFTLVRLPSVRRPVCSPSSYSPFRFADRIEKGESHSAADDDSTRLTPAVTAVTNFLSILCVSEGGPESVEVGLGLAMRAKGSSKGSSSNLNTSDTRDTYATKPR